MTNDKLKAVIKLIVENIYENPEFLNSERRIK